LEVLDNSAAGKMNFQPGHALPRVGRGDLGVFGDRDLFHKLPYVGSFHGFRQESAEADISRMEKRRQAILHAKAGITGILDQHTVADGCRRPIAKNFYRSYLVDCDTGMVLDMAHTVMRREDVPAAAMVLERHLRDGRPLANAGKCRVPIARVVTCRSRVTVRGV